MQVRNESHADPAAHEYQVTVTDGVPTACTCPADEHGDGACKHRIAVAIRRPVLDVATNPTARILRGATGGKSNRARQRQPDQPTDEDDIQPEPNDLACECAALGGSFPCWHCVRTGRKSLSDHSSDERPDTPER